MTHGDPVADDRGSRDAAHVGLGDVDHGVVLDVGLRADADGVDVAAEDGAVPDGGFLADGDVADDARGRGDEPRAGQRRGLLVDSHDRAVLGDGLAERVAALHGAADAVQRLAGLAQHRADAEHEARHRYLNGAMESSSAAGCGLGAGSARRKGGRAGRFFAQPHSLRRTDYFIRVPFGPSPRGSGCGSEQKRASHLCVRSLRGDTRPERRA